MKLIFRLYVFSPLVSLLSSLLTSSPLRSIVPLWHAKEIKEDHFQIEVTVIGWEFYAKSSMEQFVLSSSDSNQTAQVDFLELSIGDRITTISRKYLYKSDQ